MSILFTENSINGLVLKNRFVRAATWEGLATPDGDVTPQLVKSMVTLAKGGVGLIISSHSFVSEEGRATPWQIGIHKDRFVPKLKDLTSSVHDNGGKIFIQLAHAGQYAEQGLTGVPALAVSDNVYRRGTHAKIITKKDIQGTVESFANAAKRSYDSGFDGIEIHSAHGYLLSQFLSPAYNYRDDEYGGSVENRTRIHRQIYTAMRRIVGKEFPLIIKMNCADFIENGLNSDESLQAAQLFADAGFDAIEVSGGIIRTGNLSPSRPGIASEEKEAYFRTYAEIFKSKIEIPLILVGGLKSFQLAEKIINDGIADYIAMSRALIREPDLITRWQKGDLRKAECKSDNLCFNPGFEGRGVYCVSKEIEKKGKIRKDIIGVFS